MTPPAPFIAIGIVTGIVGIIGFIADAAISIAAAVAAALAAVWAVMAPILLVLWQSVSGIWTNVLQPAWTFVKAWGEQIYGLYVDHVKPIIDKLQGVLKSLRDVYRTFVQPIRDMISILDQFLRLTGLANTAFGSWLDGELHRVDGAIAQMWAELTKPINLLLHLVNEVILDARGILQAPLLLESTATYMGHIATQWWTNSIATIHTDWDKVLNEFHAGPRVATALGNSKDLLATGSGPLADNLAYGVNVFKLIASNDLESFDYQVAGVGPDGQPVTTA